MEKTLSDISLSDGSSAQIFVRTLAPEDRQIATEAIYECLRLHYPMNNMEITSKARELLTMRQKANG